MSGSQQDKKPQPRLSTLKQATCHTLVIPDSHSPIIFLVLAEANSGGQFVDLLSKWVEGRPSDPPMERLLQGRLSREIDVRAGSQVFC